MDQPVNSGAVNTFTGHNSGGIQAGQIHGNLILHQYGTNGPELGVDDACLRSLYFRGMYDEVASKSRVRGTGEWVFSHDEYKAWHDRGGVLMIGGRAGCGKSVLMAYVVNQERATQAGPEQNRVLSFCFRQADDKRHRSELGMLKSLLHGLLSENAGLLATFTKETNYVERCRSRGPPGAQWDWTVSELRDQLGQVLLKLCKTGSRVRIFLDGLDESGEAEAYCLMEAFVPTQCETANAISLCISSRAHLVGDLPHEFYIDLETEHGPDMKQYLDVQLRDNQHGAALAAVKDCLISRARHVFQWLTWICPRVVKLIRNGEEPDYIIRKIKGYPKELGDVYAQYLNLIQEEDLPDALRIFEWVALAIGPMTLNDLRYAICLEDGFDYGSTTEITGSGYWCSSEKTFAKRVRDLTKALVINVETSVSVEWLDHGASHESRELIRFDHESVREFMLDSGLQMLYARLIPSSQIQALPTFHILVAGRCLMFLKCAEIVDFRAACILEVEKDESREQDGQMTPSWGLGINRNWVAMEPPLASYAAQHWHDHIRTGESEIGDPANVLRLWASISSIDWSHIEVMERISYHDGRSFMRGGLTMLHVLSDHGCHKTLARLLMPPDGTTCEMSRIFQSMKERCRQQLNVRDEDGVTPIVFATCRGHSDITDLLIDLGAHSWIMSDNWEVVINYRDGWEQGGLFETLLDHSNADVDLKDKDGWCPILMAVMVEHIEAVRVLMPRSRLGVHCQDVAVNPQGLLTPLTCNLGRGGSHEMLRLLLTCPRIDSCLQDSLGSTALHVHLEEIAEGMIGNDCEKIQIIIESGKLDVDVKRVDGATPFLIACERKNLDSARTLLHSGKVDVRASNNQGTTALRRAVESGHVSIVAMLLEVEHAEKDLTKSLAIAVDDGHLALVRLLVRKVNMMNGHIRTVEALSRPVGACGATDAFEITSILEMADQWRAYANEDEGSVKSMERDQIKLYLWRYIGLGIVADCVWSAHIPVFDALWTSQYSVFRDCGEFHELVRAAWGLSLEP
ncbi:hypothetical protein LTR27_007475 [Elasticomyces elasticus]|nr:hypothetical protein LTR27_007475 [Elasticomyces elasticus]